MSLAITTKLERRIARLLDASANRTPLAGKRAVIATLAAGVLFAPIVLIRAQDHAPAPAAAAPGAPQRMKVGGNIQQPKLIHRTDPVYPESARAQGIEGSVVVAATIGTIGNVVNAQVINSAPPELAAAALEAIQTWQYEPALLDGQPVEVITQITLNFRLK